MTSLSDVYEGGVGNEASFRQRALGVTLFLVGAVMVVIGLVLASTEILSAIGIGRFESRRIAGLFAGLGVPSVFVGIFIVLPASTRVRAAAAIGASIAVLGVAMFWSVYPSQWLGASVERHYTFEVSAIYFVGTMITFWCLFVGIANFKTRNSPGGTVKLEVTKEGKTKVIEVDRADLRSGLGGIGLLGSTPDGSVKTQTNHPSATVSDGGARSTDIRTPGETVEPSTVDEGVDVIDGSTDGRTASGARQAGAGGRATAGADGRTTSGRRTTAGRTTDGRPDDTVDTYCGNCTHFEYVRTGTGIRPYCGYHREEMDDMEACEEWEPNLQ